MFRRVSKIPSRLHNERQSFQFDVRLLGFEGVPRKRSVVLQLQRGLRTATSKPFEVRSSGQRVCLDGSLSIICSLYRDRRTGTFESKDCKLRLLGVQSSSRRSSRSAPDLVQKALEKVHFDVTQFLGELGSGIRREHVFVLSNGSRVHTTVCLSWVGSYRTERHPDSASSYAPSELSRMSIESTLWSDGSNSSSDAADDHTLETVPPISNVEPVVPTSTSLGSSAQHVEETAIETRPMHWNAREQAATGPSLSMNARTISVEAKPQELLHQVASVMADSTEKDGISSPGAHAHRLGDGWYAQLPPGNVLVSTFSSKEESSEPSLRQVEPASEASAEYRLAEGDPSTDDATAEAEALANMLSRLCDGERSDVECFFGLWQTQGHRVGTAAREMNAEIRRPRTESMTVAWEKCSVLASALDALYQNLHSLQLDLSGCVDPSRITVVPESQENDKVVSSREPSRLLDTTQHALVPWPSSVQPTRLHSVRIDHSIADITAEVQLLSDAIQQKKIRARELGRQLASAVDSMQVMSRTLLPQLHREVEHSFALASSTLAEVMEQFKRRAMDSTLQALRPGPETMDAVKRSEMVGPTFHAILVSLRHLQHALQSMRDIVQQQQQGQLSISAPASCRPAVRYPLRHVPCERFLAQTARCRAQLFDWRQHVTEHSCVSEDLFRQLNEALYHLASTKPSAKAVRRVPSPNRDQSGILAMLRGQRRRVYSLRTALVRVRASCIDEFTSWQRLFEEHRNRLVTKAAHAERQQGYVMNPNAHSRPDMEETQPNPLTRSVLSQRTTSALSAEEPRALVVELIETKLALAEQKEVEEHLRREMRRQQRELHQTIAKLGETVSRLEIKLAKKRNRSRSHQLSYQDSN